MIPILLKLKGIYSYQAEQVIDFSKLTANHLFGIFGGVGSGKSTILEAITYALYGNTERLSGNDKRSYNMMNLKSDELTIDFIFSAGRENKQYRFTVTAKRNKKHFDQVGTYSRNAYVKENDTWLPLDSNKADDILGLSYDNFRRTIIIPQGKFQEFLQLGDTERTKMLQEIFRLDKFDLSDKVRAHLYKKNMN
jgi:exonuclease SbcC